MHQLAPAADRPAYRSFRNAALGGASLIAIAAAALTPALGAEAPDPVIQIAQRPSQSQPPLTDKNTPWDQQRAESARDATKAMNDAIQGFKGVAQHAILTNNVGLLNLMKALIKYYGDLCEALKDRAYDMMTSGTNLTPATAKAARGAAGNGQLGKESADHALEEIEKAQTPSTQRAQSSQQSQATPRSSTTTQTAAAHPVSNTVIPADPSRSPTVCAPGEKCTASLNDTLIAWSPKGIGDERMRVSDLCRLSYECTPVAGQSGMVQFSPVDRPEPSRTAAAGSSSPDKILSMTSGGYLNPFQPVTQPTSPEVSAQTWAMFNNYYQEYRNSTGQPSANAMRTDVSRALTGMFTHSDYVDYAAMTDLSASNVLMRSHISFLDNLTRQNPPNGRGGLWDYGMSAERRLATKQVLNEDFGKFAARETVPTFRTQWETDFSANAIRDYTKFWSGSVLKPTTSASDTLQITDAYKLDWKGISPRLGMSYAYGPKKDTLTNGYIRYSFDGSGVGAGDKYVPSNENVTEAAKAKAVVHVVPADVLTFDNSTVLRRNLTGLYDTWSVTDMRGAFLGYSYNWGQSTRWSQMADPGKGCDSLAFPTGKIGNYEFTRRWNFDWTTIVPATPDAGAVCELGIVQPGLFYSAGQQLVAKRSTFVDAIIDAMISSWFGCDYYYYDYAPPPRGIWETARLLTTQSPHPNDPLLSSKGTWRQNYDDQWWMKAIGWLKPDGTTVLPDSAKPVTVAVIDSGIDLRHPELFGALWVNPKEPAQPPRPGMFRNPVRAHWLGWNFLEDSGDIRDFNGHGTVVAGIIAADVNNRTGIAGINPWAKIMPLKVADHRGRSSSLAASKAIVYAADNGARVINMSLGNDKLSEVVKRAIDYAARKGVLIVVSSGNKGVDTKDFTPSAFANTIAVAAVDTEFKRAGFSNFGDNVTISAPGVDILSLRAGGTDLMRFFKADYRPGSAVVNDRYYRVDGTSFAAPMVAGVASLILSMRPELSAAEVKRMILQSARDVAGTGRDRNLGYGVLDADAALRADPAFFVDGVISGLSVVQASGRQAVRVTGTATADRLRGAWIEIGQGETPTEWKKVTDNVTRPVENGVIGEIETRNLAGSRVWTVKVVVEHQNGRKREGRYVLRLG